MCLSRHGTLAAGTMPPTPDGPRRLEEASTGKREESPEGLLAQLGVYRASLNVLLEIVNNTLRRSIKENPELVYAILSKQEVLSGARTVQERACEMSRAGQEELEGTLRLVENIEQVRSPRVAALSSSHPHSRAWCLPPVVSAPLTV